MDNYDAATYGDRIAEVYDDAIEARELGMSGKWVGHPAQLWAVLLAFDAGLEEAAIERAISEVRAYAGSVSEEGKGAIVIEGSMVDRATDRHARMLLRRAVAYGRFDPRVAERLGIISEHEASAIVGGSRDA